MASLRSDLPSIRAAITRTVLWIVATMVISAAGVRELSRTREFELSESATALTVAQLLGAQSLLDFDGRAVDPQLICDRLCRQPAILGAYLFDGDSRLQASACRDAALDRAAAAVEVKSRQTLRFSLPIGSQGGRAAVRLTDVELTAATDASRAAAGSPRVLRLVMAPPPVSKKWYQGLWIFCAPILAVGMIGSFIGLRRLDREVVNPISRLTAMARGDLTTGHSSAEMEHPDELGDLAAAMKSMREDLDTWRDRAQKSARTIDQQVAERTQEIYRELKRAQREVWTDAMTGLNNRRAMTERFPAIFDAQKEARQDLSVVMFDVDHFKTLNDTLGHQAGDELIRFTAELLRGSLRQNDLAIRYGGDEFMLVLPSVNSKTAESIARRTGALFSQRVKLIGKLPTRPSLSAGVASLREHAPASAQELIAQADKALYEAKAAGKSDVRVYSSEAERSRLASDRALAPAGISR